MIHTENHIKIANYLFKSYLKHGTRIVSYQNISLDLKIPINVIASISNNWKNEGCCDTTLGGVNLEPEGVVKFKEWNLLPLSVIEE